MPAITPTRSEMVAVRMRNFFIFSSPLSEGNTYVPADKVRHSRRVEFANIGDRMNMPLFDGYQVSKGDCPYFEVYVCCAALSMEESTILYRLLIKGSVQSGHMALRNRPDTLLLLLIWPVLGFHICRLCNNSNHSFLTRHSQTT